MPIYLKTKNRKALKFPDIQASQTKTLRKALKTVSRNSVKNFN